LVYVEYLVEMLDREITQGTTTWIEVPTAYRQVILLDPTKFVNPTFEFEFISKASLYPGMVWIRLVDQGTSDAGNAAYTVVTTLTNSYNDYALVYSYPFTPTSNHRYRFQIQVSLSGNTGYYHAVRVRIYDDVTAGWTKGQEQIELGDANQTTTSGTAVELPAPPIYLYEAAKRDGTVTGYFEATFYSAQANRAVQVSLWNRTDNTQVVELSSTATVPTRVRSSSFNLVDGKEYYVKIRSSSGRKLTLTGAKLILDQTGTLTKTQLMKRTGSYGTVTGTSYVYLNWLPWLHKEMLPPVLDIYYEAALKAGSGVTAYSLLRDRTNLVDVAGSEVSTPLTLWTRLRSGKVAPIDGALFDSAIKSSGATAIQLSSGWMIIDASLPAPVMGVKTLPMSYLKKPVKAKELLKSVDGGTVIQVTNDFPPILVAAGEAQILWSKWI